MPHWLAQQWMTLNGRIAWYLCGSWASCFLRCHHIVHWCTWPMVPVADPQYSLARFVRNVNVCCLIEQPSLSSTISSRRLSLFGNVAHMDRTADANWILFEPTSELWRRPLVDHVVQEYLWLTTLYLVQEYLWLSHLWHRAAGGKKCSWESFFPEDVDFT